MEDDTTEFIPQPSTSGSTPRVSDKPNTTQNTNTVTHKTHKITPIIVTEKDKWAQIRQLLKTHNIKTVQSKLVKQGIHIEPKTDDDYRTIKHILNTELIQFYTYQLQSEKTLKVVMRGIPTFITDTDITNDLTDQGYPPLKIKRMNGKNGIPAPLVLIELTRQYKSIFNIHDCCGLTIKIEPLNTRTDIIQCHKCQTFGHQQRHCNVQYKCMKCDDSHSTHLCLNQKQHHQSVQTAVVPTYLHSSTALITRTTLTKKPLQITSQHHPQQQTPGHKNETTQHQTQPTNSHLP